MYAIIFNIFIFFYEICSIIGAIIIVCGLYTVVWGKSKDSVNNTTQNEGQELPIKDATKTGSDIFESVEVNVPNDIKLGGKNVKT
jgi:hypothetical protein